MIYSATAIVLRRRDHGEWDRRYTVLTREHGKLSLIAKGTRRPKAKLASHLEPYALVDLMVARGRTMDRVTFARVLRSGEPFARSWGAHATAATCAELVDQLVREGIRERDTFDLLDAALVAIAAAGAESVIIVTPFTLRLLALLGYAPRMDYCLECKRPPGPVAVTGIPERGGFLCHQCHPSASAGTMLAAEDAGRISVFAAAFRPEVCSSAITQFTDALLAQHLVVPLRTSSLLPG